MKRVFVVVLVLGVVLIGCVKKEEKKTGPYLVKINNTTITKEDLAREIETLPAFAQKMFEGEEGTAKLIDELVKKELLYQEAKKRGFDKDPAFIRKVEDSKKLMLISALLEKEIEDKAKVSDKEVRDFYEQHKADFTEKGRTIEFESIKGILAQRLTAQKQREVFDTYVENLKKSYTIDMNKQAIADLSKSQGQQGKEEPKTEVKEPPKKQ